MIIDHFDKLMAITEICQTREQKDSKFCIRFRYVYFEKSVILKVNQMCKLQFPFGMNERKQKSSSHTKKILYIPYESNKLLKLSAKTKRQKTCFHTTSLLTSTKYKP